MQQVAMAEDITYPTESKLEWVYVQSNLLVEAIGQ